MPALCREVVQPALPLHHQVVAHQRRQPRQIPPVPRLLARHEQPARVRLELVSGEVRIIRSRLRRGPPHGLHPLPHLPPVAPAVDRQVHENTPKNPNTISTTNGFPEPDPLPPQHDPPPPEKPPPPPPPPNPELPPPACAQAELARTHAKSSSGRQGPTSRRLTAPMLSVTQIAGTSAKCGRGIRAPMLGSESVTWRGRPRHFALYAAATTIAAAALPAAASAKLIEPLTVSSHLIVAPGHKGSTHQVPPASRRSQRGRQLRP